MPSVREVRKKIKSVKQTQQVTRAMKMISAARLKRFQANLIASRPYAYKVSELVGDIAERLRLAGQEMPSLMKPRAAAPDRALLVFSSDKGLCGSFNTILLREALKFYEATSASGGKTWLFVVGRKARDFFERQHFAVEREFVGMLRRPSFVQAEILASELLDFYKAHPQVGAIFSLYSQFKSLLKNEPTVSQLAPLIPRAQRIQAKTEARFDYIYEPAKEMILEALLPRALKVEIYRQILETATSEQASRMNVMENATRNASDLIESFTLLANKIRQASITREILEVVSGAEALV